MEPMGVSADKVLDESRDPYLQAEDRYPIMSDSNPHMENRGSRIDSACINRVTEGYPERKWGKRVTCVKPQPRLT